jgi:hypothetical protein
VQLTNTTSLAARATANDVFGVPGRVGMIVAKATFTFGARGEIAADTQTPMPVFGRDQVTPMGILPSDDQPWHDDAFEVLVFGTAHAPRGRATTAMRVAVTVGHDRRELLVTGDRRWIGPRHGTPYISDAQPFEHMPLTWERAFGGRSEVHVDRGAVLSVDHPDNPAGRGFDPAASARAIARMLRAPAGFPWFDRTRLLPNVEDPHAPISRWDDAPQPKCWAALPITSAMYATRAVAPDGGSATSTLVQAGASHRAHPDWIVSRPQASSDIVLEGLTPEGRVAFPLPAMRVFADYALGSRRGTFELAPHLLAIVPDARRIYVVYRHTFTFACSARDTRALRLRTARGWIATRPEEACA